MALELSADLPFFPTEVSASFCGAGAENVLQLFHIQCRICHLINNTCFFELYWTKLSASLLKGPQKILGLFYPANLLECLNNFGRVLHFATYVWCYSFKKITSALNNFSNFTKPSIRRFFLFFPPHRLFTHLWKCTFLHQQ